MISNELIDRICTGSDRQLDASLKPRLEALKDRDDDGVKDELKQIIGDSINYALTSGFTLTVLQQIYVNLGGDIADVVGQIHVTPID